MPTNSLPPTGGAHPPPGSSIKERREARERVADASMALYLLADTDCPPEKIERVGQIMDAHASVLRGQEVRR